MKKIVASLVCFGFVIIFFAILAAIGLEADSLGIIWNMLIAGFIVSTVPVIWKKIMKNEKPKKTDK